MNSEIVKALEYYSNVKTESKSERMSAMAATKAAMMIFKLKDFNDRHKFTFYGKKDD